MNFSEAVLTSSQASAPALRAVRRKALSPLPSGILRSPSSTTAPSGAPLRLQLRLASGIASPYWSYTSAR